MKAKVNDKLRMPRCVITKVVKKREKCARAADLITFYGESESGDSVKSGTICVGTFGCLCWTVQSTNMEESTLANFAVLNCFIITNF